MKIERSAVVAISNTEDPAQFLKVLTPHDELGVDANIFALYVSQKSWGAETTDAMKHPEQDVMLAIGTPEQGETVATVLQKGSDDDWHPASLIHWDAYRKIHGKKLDQIAILGTVCRDDDFHEWAFTIAHKKIVGVPHEYRLSAKPLDQLKQKTLPVLLIKIPRKKT